MPEQKKKDGYFLAEQEAEFAMFIMSKDAAEKERIFKRTLQPAFTKMIESIIRRYNLYIPDEDFEQTFTDTMSFLLTKVEKFDLKRGKKAYSYCGTVCKNYLIGRTKKFNHEQQKLISYDALGTNEFGENILCDRAEPVSTKIRDEKQAVQLIEDMIAHIHMMLDNRQTYSLTDNDVRIGTCMLHLLENREAVWAQLDEMANKDNDNPDDKWNDPSEKFNKQYVMWYYKDNTMMSTPEIRKSRNKFIEEYKKIKLKNLE